jgi:hypothetical protein
MSFIPRIYFDIIFDGNIVKSYNINFIKNLEKDINLLQVFFNEVSKECSKFSTCLDEMLNLLAFFLKKQTDYFLNIKKEHNKIQKKEFINFIQRYKNLKKKVSNDPSITEADIQVFIKKIN